MGKIFLIIAWISCSLLHRIPVQAQYYFYNSNYYESAITWEAGGSAGGMNCLTDLGGSQGKGRPFIRDVNWNYTRPCAGMYVNCLYKNTLGIRLECSFGQVTACDSVLKNTPSAAYGRYLRNLSFRSGITEAVLVVECYPLHFLWNSDEHLPSLSPYVYAGLGYFGFTPEARIGNTWINLPALHTEGQGFAAYPGRRPYPLAQFNLPLGAGVRYDISPVLSCRFELAYRKLWTDYLDDVSTTYIDPALFYRNLPLPMARLASQLADRSHKSSPAFTAHAGDIRGNHRNNDAYFSVNLKIAFVFGRQKIR